MRLFAPFALACLAPLTAHAGTFTVGPQAGPGIDFTSIQAAINAAAEGDLILVNAGAYTESLVVDGKSLTLLGNGTPTLFVNSQTPGHAPLLAVRNLSASQSFDMLGFGFSSFSGVQKDAIELDSNTGRIWLEELFIDSFDGHGLRAIASSEVVLSDVFLQVNAAFTDAQGFAQPAHGMLVENGSSVRAYGLTATGSHIAPILTTPTTPVVGGDAVRVIDSTVLMIDPDLIGGSGGSVFSGGCSSAAAGGSALAVFAQGGPAPSVQFRGGTLLAGAAGFFDPACAPAPPAVPAINDPAQAVTTLSGTPRSLDMPSMATLSGAFEFQVRGAASDIFFVFANAGEQAPLPIAGVDGDLFLNPASSFLGSTGTLNASGFGGMATSFSNPGPTIGFRTQALFFDTQGAFWLSGPSSIYFL